MFRGLDDAASCGYHTATVTKDKVPCLYLSLWVNLRTKVLFSPNETDLSALLPKTVFTIDLWGQSTIYLQSVLCAWPSLLIINNLHLLVRCFRQAMKMHTKYSSSTACCSPAKALSYQQIPKQLQVLFNREPQCSSGLNFFGYCSTAIGC